MSFSLNLTVIKLDPDKLLFKASNGDFYRNRKEPGDLLISP